MKFLNLNFVLIAAVIASSVIVAQLGSDPYDAIWLHLTALTIDLSLACWLVLWRKRPTFRMFCLVHFFISMLHLCAHALELGGVVASTLVSLLSKRTDIDLLLLISLVIGRVIKERIPVKQSRLDPKYTIKWRRTKGLTLAQRFVTSQSLVQEKRDYAETEYAAELVLAQTKAQVLVPAPVAAPQPANRFQARGAQPVVAIPPPPVNRARKSTDIKLGEFDSDLRNAAYMTQPLLLKAPHFSVWKMQVTNNRPPFATKNLRLQVCDELVSACVSDAHLGLLETTPDFFRRTAYTYAGLNIPYDLDSKIRDNSAAAAYWTNLKRQDKWNAMIEKPLYVPQYSWSNLMLSLVIRSVTLSVAWFTNFQVGYTAINLAVLIGALRSEGTTLSF